jgi:ubiquinone/menaquinone biosynthesis C-methylase UbiE
VSIDAFYTLTPEQREEVFEELSPENFDAMKTDLDRIKAERKDLKLVGGRAESLPFSNGTFDVVLAEFSLPNHAESFEQVRDFFFEVARVLKPNGQARIYPMRFRKVYELGSSINRKVEGVFDQLRAEGLGVEITSDQLLIISKL